ncbi:MAG: glycosyltransferase [Clostridia bacterium]|nr:glycosyltransferase [Clostridia bacterium]
MKKICIVTTISDTMKAFVLDSAKYLHNVGGYDVTLICDRDENFARELPEYLHYIPVKIKRGISLSGFSTMRKLRKIFEKERFDMVQYSTPNASYYASWAAKKAKIPVRLYCQWGMLYISRKGLVRAAFKHLEKKICNNSTYIQPDSFGNLEFCRREGLYGEKNSGVIWNGSAKGVNLEKFDISKKSEYNAEIRQKYGILENDIVIGTVGRLGREKGSNELIKAFEILKRSYPGAKLMLVGPIEKKNTIEPRVLKYFLECEDIIKVGWTNEVEKYLSAMNVFVIPSYREGFGLSAIEASAMAVPVVATEYPGPANVVVNKKTGFRIKIGSVDEIVSAVELILMNEENSAAMAQNAYSYAKVAFDERIFLEKYLENRRRILGDVQ